MPNHITNRLTIIGTEEQVKQVREAIKGEREEQFIDFNKIAPIPKELENTQSPLTIISQKEYDEQEKRIADGNISDDEKNWGLSRGLTQKLADEYKKKFGYAEWYGWQNANWGTKWNAYEQCSIDEDVIEFQTAWSTPFSLLVNLSLMFPEVTFEVRYADEDFGYNVGEFTLLGGDEILTNIPDGGSDEAYELAMDIQYGTPEEYFDCNEEIFTDDYINEDEGELSGYVSQMVDLAYKHKHYPSEDCNYHKLALERFKELALADENFELVIVIDKELNKVEN
jgi:hypothetical protein